MAILVLVSFCMRFCVLPRGPMMRPMKLYAGCVSLGMNTFFQYRLGLGWEERDVSEASRQAILLAPCP